MKENKVKKGKEAETLEQEKDMCVWEFFLWVEYKIPKIASYSYAPVDNLYIIKVLKYFLAFCEVDSQNITGVIKRGRGYFRPWHSETWILSTNKASFYSIYYLFIYI